MIWNWKRFFPANPKPEHLDERVLERLLNLEPFIPMSVLTAAHLLANEFPDHPAVEEALVDTFTNMFVFIPKKFKLTKAELTKEFLRWKRDPSYLDKIPTVPLYDLFTNVGKAIMQILSHIGENKALKEEGLLYELRKKIWENEADIHGITVRQRLSKKVPWPWELKEEQPETLVRMYLLDTPFFEFFHTRVPFVMPKKALSEHCFIVAKPGHGKTQLLGSFVAQFLQDPSKPGVFCLDPAGDWFEIIRDRVDPSRLVVLDPETDPPPLNFFDFKNTTEAEALQSFLYLMSSLTNGLSDKQGNITPFMLRLLSKVEKPSLRVLRKIVDERVKRPQDSAYFFAIQQLDEDDRDFFIHQFFNATMNPTKDAISVKISGAMGYAAFKKMFTADTNSFDARAAMRDRKVVIARGSETTLGEFGLPIFLQYVVSQFFLASLARFRIPERERHQCYLLCDEASHIFNHQTTRILVECRKLGLSFFGATQVIDQIPTEVKAAIYGATSVKAAGKVSFSDASVLAREMRTTPDFIQNMKTFEWAFYVADADKALKVVVPPGSLEAMPTQKTAPVQERFPLPDTEVSIVSRTSILSQTNDHPTKSKLDSPPKKQVRLVLDDANGRVDKALRLLARALQPLIEQELRRVHSTNWQQQISFAQGSDPTQPFDPYAALKTMLDNWQSCFKETFKLKMRTDVSKALEARNAISHVGFEIPAADAISYLAAIRDIAVAISATPVADVVKAFIEDQIKAAVIAIDTTPLPETHESPSKPAPKLAPKPTNESHEPVAAVEPLVKPGKEWD